MKLRIVDGEICVRGPQVFPGYFNDDAATAAKLRDGWLHTGDHGRLDDDGCLYVTGRQRAMIKRGGRMIVPGDVEAAAERAPHVQSAAAVGIERASGLGAEDVVVEVEGGIDVARAVSDQVTAEIGFAPARVIAVAPGALPRTDNGKIRHGELKQLIQDGQLEPE